MASTVAEDQYVLGTHDEEIQRLGVQHRAWRPSVFAAWQAAGIREGHSILDVGSGPGYAALDLGETVGPRGLVIAIDKSERFPEGAGICAARKHFQSLRRSGNGKVSRSAGATRVVPLGALLRKKSTRDSSERGDGARRRRLRSFARILRLQHLRQDTRRICKRRDDELARDRWRARHRATASVLARRVAVRTPGSSNC